MNGYYQRKLVTLLNYYQTHIPDNISRYSLAWVLVGKLWSADSVGWTGWSGHVLCDWYSTMHIIMWPTSSGLLWYCQCIPVVILVNYQSFSVPVLQHYPCRNCFQATVLPGNGDVIWYLLIRLGTRCCVNRKQSPITGVCFTFCLVNELIH